MQVAGSGDLPVVGKGDSLVCAGSFKEPEAYCTVCFAVNKICQAVAVEVAGGNEGTVVREFAQRLPCRYSGSIQEPCTDILVGIVVKENIGKLVAVEVFGIPEIPGAGE